MNYAEALRTTFEKQGWGSLKDPQKLLNTMCDWCDEDSLELRVLSRQCDEEFLTPFVKSCTDNKIQILEEGVPREVYGPFKQEDTQEAVRRATEILIARNVYPDVARSVTDGLGKALDGSAESYLQELQPYNLIDTQDKGEEQTNSSLKLQYVGCQNKSGAKAGSAKPLKNRRRLTIGAVVVLLFFIHFVAFPSQIRGAIYFEPNGTSEGHVSTIYPNGGDELVFPECDFVRETYDFVGWCLDPTGEGKIYQPGDAVASAGDDGATYYAIWQKRQVRLSFDGNGADEGSMDDLMVDMGSDYILPDCSFACSGCTFGY